MPPKKDDKEESPQSTPLGTPDRLSPVPRDERQNVQRDVADVQRMTVENSNFYATLRNNYPEDSVEAAEAINFFDSFSQNWEEMGMNLARAGYLAEGTRIQDMDPVTREQFGRLAARSMHTFATFATVVQGLTFALIRHAQTSRAAREGSAGPSGSSAEAGGSAGPSRSSGETGESPGPSGSSRETGESPGPPESKRPREKDDSSGDSAS